MGKLMVRKLIVAVVFAVIAPFVVVALIAGLAKDIQLVGGAAASFSTLLNSEGMAVALIVMAILAFIISFVSAQLVPARRRRQRSSGTMVESDVEDGRERGVVKWFNVKKGFGFITWDEGEDVFVHFRSIRGQGHRSLTEGQRVKFSVVRGEKGPQAEDVSAIR
ncbi:cold-shock DNA-binding protein family [Thalassolituus maritimus]|uniref:Cold-shock DNA-binding protein family n=1 Tax=Thalassolituus maritimus TaxID=484498 RepID=A0A1N7J4X5_9GAMM|nr:cold shock domain-containing protein [Thalassolituus maritimus]SIS44297.1 cold-shock DNA-binding protein family [Thalassolituus maritimus]